MVIMQQSRSNLSLAIFVKIHMHTKFDTAIPALIMEQVSDYAQHDPDTSTNWAYIVNIVHHVLLLILPLRISYWVRKDTKGVTLAAFLRTPYLTYSIASASVRQMKVWVMPLPQVTTQ